ncbi:CarD family transcriptional regulator, partial [Enterococcus durans]
MDIIQMIGKDPQVKEWINQLEEKTPRQLVTGLAGSAKTLLFARAFKKTKKNLIVLMPNLYYANQLAEDLQHVLPAEQIHSFPVDEVLSAEMAFSSPEARGERVATLNALQQKQPGIYLLPVAALHKRLPQPKTWQQAQLNWQVGEEIDLANLPQHFALMGYERVEMVAKPGEYSIRGSIIDIYPLTIDYPVRVELFDVEIDSMRYFEPDTQRSIEKINEIWIAPTSEQVYGQEDLLHGINQVETLLEKKLATTSEKTDRAFLEDYFGQLVSQWQAGNPTEEAKFYADLLYQTETTILDYFPTNSLLIVDDYQRIMETNREMEREAAEWQTQKISELRVFSEQVLVSDVHKLVQKEKFITTFFVLFQKGMGNLRFQAIHNFQYRTMQQFFGQMPLLKTEMDRWRKQGQTVVIFIPTKERIKKAEQMLRDEEILVVETEQDKLIRGQVQLVEGALQTGFELPQEKIVAITEKEIFQKTTKKQTRRQTVTNAERLKSYNELKAGDYVVHANHGIGKYIGMETLEVDG